MKVSWQVHHTVGHQGNFMFQGVFSDKLTELWELVYFVLRIIIDSKPVLLIAIVKLSSRKASSS